jgi:hypothetical protein
MLDHLPAYCVAAAIAVAATGCGSGSSSDVAHPTWPKQVTLQTRQSVSVNGEDGVRLSDGVIAMGQGDFNLAVTMVLSLRSPTPESFCEKGKVSSLADVPTELGACSPGVQWTPGLMLSGSSVHKSEESYMIGLGALVRDASHQSLYRLRILGDSYNEQGLATATFEYEPVR